MAITEPEIAESDNRPSGARAAARRQAILDAALALLMEVGYDRMSMDGLAERAHAGKATIYRHWTGKAEVVVEAIRCRKCDNFSAPPDTGSLRGDLWRPSTTVVSPSPRRTRPSSSAWSQPCTTIRSWPTSCVGRS